MSRRFHLLGPLDAVNGTLAFGWSTAIIVAVVTRLVRVRHRAEVRRGRSAPISLAVFRDPSREKRECDAGIRIEPIVWGWPTPCSLTQLESARTIVLHLGNGSSMCALDAGRSIASTMGFTAVEGLPMGTRCGGLDPGVILYLMDERKMDARAIERLLPATRSGCWDGREKRGRAHDTSHDSGGIGGRRQERRDG